MIELLKTFNIDIVIVLLVLSGGEIAKQLIKTKLISSAWKSFLGGTVFALIYLYLSFHDEVFTVLSIRPMLVSYAVANTFYSHIMKWLVDRFKAISAAKA